MKTTLKALLAIAAIGATSSVSAIKYDAAVDGLTPPTGVTFSSFSTAGPSSPVIGYDQGISYLGVIGGNADDEIGTNERLIIEFDTPARFSNIVFGLLYDGPEFNDSFEIAAAIVNGGFATYTLQALTATTAVWSGVGSTVTNLSPAWGSTAAVWQVDNPFGGLLVSKLVLKPISHNRSSNNSDFGLVSFEVPDTGATLALLGLGLVFVAVLRRRKA